MEYIIPFSIYIVYNTLQERFMSLKRIKIHDDQEYIELGNLLKVAGIIDTGGYAKMFLNENKVYINGERDTRRGRKLYRGDVVKVNKIELIVE